MNAKHKRRVADFQRRILDIIIDLSFVSHQLNDAATMPAPIHEFLQGANEDIGRAHRRLERLRVRMKYTAAEYAKPTKA